MTKRAAARAGSTHHESPCHATAMRKASRRLTQLYDDALEAAGLRSTQFTILNELDGRGSQAPTVADLASALVTDRSSLGHNLRPLERDGYVALEEGAYDRRRRHVVLTPRGRAKYREGLRHWMAAQKRFIAVFGEREAGHLRDTLLRVAYDDRLATLRD